MDKLILGRYVPGNSFIHRLDPRSKLLAMFVFLTIIFWANNLVTNAVVAAFLLGLMLLSGLGLSVFITGLKPVISLLFFTTAFQVFFTPGQHILWKWWFIQISLESLQQAGIIFARFVFIVLFSTLLTLTTTPLSLADGIEMGLAPLKRFKVPVHEIGLLLSLSLRFVPTLMDDTLRIMNAQRARGVDFEEGNLIQRVRALVPILIPLFASSLKRADALGIAMEARGYQGGEGRSKYRVLQWKSADTLTLLVMILLGLCLFFLKS